MLTTIKNTLWQIFFTFFFATLGYAGAALWTFTPVPYYPSTVSITPAGFATIKYIVTNQSSRAHTLVMQPIPGIAQITTAGNCPNPFMLGSKQSCTLSLLVNGSALTRNVNSGPVVCQQGSTLECYQPSSANVLNITRIPLAQYLITPSADINGAISPNTPQIALAGSNFTFTAIPNANYSVNQWIVDGGVAQNGGTSYTLPSIVSNHTVNVTFTLAGTIYAGTASGGIYYSTNNGLTWSQTTTPSPGFGVNSLFASSTMLYAGSADGKVYYSSNNGALWNATVAVPNGAAVNGVYAGINIIYAGTQDGKFYYSMDGTSWTATTRPGAGAVNSIFITSSGTIYVGSGDGNVYYSTNAGTTWNTMTGPTTMSGMSIQNVYVANNQLYVNARHVSSNSTLPSGTVDFEYAYTSNSLTSANPTWTLFSQISYTLFVNSDASIINAGTQNGYVFSLTTGNELGFVTSSPITSLFFF